MAIHTFQRNVPLGRKTDFLLASSVSVPLERGMLMCEVDDGGVRAVAPSTGGGAEKFLGVLWSDTLSITDGVPVVESQRIPLAGPLAITLKRLPAGASLLVLKGSTVIAAGVAAGNYGIVGKVVTLIAAGAAAIAAGDLITFRYRYASDPAAIDAAFGVRAINRGYNAAARKATLITGPNDLFMSVFLTTGTFAITGAVKTAANGKLDGSAGSGTTIGLCTALPAMIEGPGLPQAFVGFEFNTPNV